MTWYPYTGPSMPLVKLQYHATALVPEPEVWAWLEDGWTRVEEDKAMTAREYLNYE